MRAFAYGCLVASLAGCASDRPIVDASPDERPAIQMTLERTRPNLVLPAPQDYYRIDLARTSGEVRLLGIERVTRTIRPMPSLSPEYLLVSSRGGVAVGATPLGFPTTAHSILEDETGQPLPHEELEVLDSRVSVSVEATQQIDLLELVSAADETLLSIPASQLMAASSTGRGGGSGASDGGFTVESLRAKYPEIFFPAPRQVPTIEPKLLRGGDLEEISPAYAAEMDRALSTMEPIVRGSIQTIAVTTFSPREVGAKPGARLGGNTLGPQIVLSSELADRVGGILVHEAAHAFDHATFGAAGGRQPNAVEAVRPEWLQHLKPTLEEFHLLNGFRYAWETLHESGVHEGLAQPYSLNEDGTVSWDVLNNRDAYRAGFWSAYGATKAADDIAEVIRERTLPTPNETPCDRFVGAWGGSPDHVIPYAKLVLLAGLGAISQASFDDCIGESYSVIPTSPGFSFPGYRNRLEDSTSAGYRGNPRNPTYDVAAAGLGYRLRFRIQLDDANDTPIGLHHFWSITDANVANAGATDHAALFGQEPKDTRASRTGYMLLIEAKEGSAKGIVFGLALQDRHGKVTETFPYIPFLVQ